MNHRSILTAGFLVVTGLALVSCQSRENAGLTPADETAIRQGYEAMARAANGGNAAEWASLYAEDAVLLPPHGPTVHGREAIEKWIAGLPPISNTRAEVTEIQGWGDTAFAWGNYSMTIAIPGIPAPFDDRGKYLEIW